MIIEKLEKFVKENFVDAGFSVENIKVIRSNRPDLCDYQCDDIFRLAKIYHKNPMEIGEMIVRVINSNKDFNLYFDKVEFIAPGFINMTLSDKFINQFLVSMENDLHSVLNLNEEETYVVDFGGANVAKPLHVGHMSTILFGESIARILRFLKNKVITDVHLGDYGLQIGQVIYGILRDKRKIEEIDIIYLDKIYPEMSHLCKENESIKEKCAEITKKLQDGNFEYKQIWEKILEVSIADIKKNYDYLGAHFDLWLGESDAYDLLDETEKILSSKHLLEMSMGALVVNVARKDDKKEIPPLLFKKANGAYLYASTDISTILKRKKDYKPNHILYVVDNRQSLHFEQVFRACDKAGIMSYESLEHLPYGTVNGVDGKPYKTRSGDSPKLENLFTDTKNIFISKKEENKNMTDNDLNIIVNAILKFAILQNSRERDYIFDLNKFSDVTGKTGPYVLYTYLRIQKILENEKSETISFTNTYNKYDRDLKIKLLDYPVVIQSSFKERMPHYIADYVYNLCVTANIFYQNNHITNLDDTKKKEEWLSVLTLTNKLIKQLLELLIIEIPSVM